ncbi:MAG TPA: hypothetical protein VFE24_17775 [Pirellulales bacterium]|jgi:hypothetical protein|nr:hypothetical protein [Pirellulales bacterium]
MAVVTTNTPAPSTAPPHAPHASLPPAPIRSNGTIYARRVQFMAEAPAEGRVRAQFAQPYAAVAIEDEVNWKDYAAVHAAGDPLDQLVVVFVPPAAEGEWKKTGRPWLTPPHRASDPRKIRIEGTNRFVEWQPGRAVVQCPSRDFDALFTALIEFTFYQRELLALEAALADIESSAPADTAYAFQIRRSNRQQWQRLIATNQALAKLRLRYARLDPCFYKPSPALPVEGRRVMARLLDKTDCEDRMEAFNDRLEACEELYVGATDRITDYRWWRSGHWLEIGIIVLLFIEGLLVATDVYLRYLDYTTPEDKAAAAAEAD